MTITPFKCDAGHEHEYGLFYEDRRDIARYIDLGAQYPGILLFVRMGDFYEAFGDSAVIIADALQITLTSRMWADTQYSMAGVHEDAIVRDIARLIHKGHRCAIIETLVEDQP